ncbi:hypothetical protein BDB01DRAFT_493170 [Pilobolus umbonatus]|nr:hypothetical protein BDB01DRAFT_493170 [Pilobolus umbonatus]
MKMSDGRTYVMTRSVIRIARLLNMYSLAELCKLTPNEILGKVAEPLLRIIQYDQWQTTSPSSCIVNIEIIQYTPMDNEWPFNSSLPDTCMNSSGDTQNIMHLNNNNQSVVYNIKDCATLHQWLSSTIHENCSPNNCSPAMIQSLISAAKIKRQQQAIIETRQRLTIFNIPNKKDKILKSATSNGVIVFDRKKSKKYTSSLSSNLAGSIKDNGLPIPTSTIPNPLKRKRCLQIDTRRNKAKVLSRHQEDNIYPQQTHQLQYPKHRPMNSHQQNSLQLHHIQESYQHQKHPYKLHSLRHHPPSLLPHPLQHRQQQYSSHDNLNLLATQATQIRDLPISPDITPSPPPLLMLPKTSQSHHIPRLPSLQTMLSELRQPSLFQLGRNMDSYA